MATCDEIREYLAAYADGELDDTARARVRAHLIGCPDCRRDLAGLETVDALLRRSPTPEPSEAEWDKVSVALDREIQSAVAVTALPRERARSRAWWLVPAGALAAAAAVMVVLLSMPKPEPPAEITTLEVGPTYEYNVTLPAKEGDFLIIDVTNVE